MSRPVTLGTLVTRCRNRFGGQGDELADATELKGLISEYYAELHALVSEKGARYFETEATVTATGASGYALPADHMSTILVDRVISGTTGPRQTLNGPISMQERAALIGLTGGGPAAGWALEGSSLVLYPYPPSGTYKHLYVPQPADLSTSIDSTSVDVINVYGERLVLWGVASVAQHKGKESQSRAVDEYQKALAQLEYWACQRALIEPSRRVARDEADSVSFVDVNGFRRFR